jgi:hypothetical protein
MIYEETGETASHGDCAKFRLGEKELVNLWNISTI